MKTALYCRISTSDGKQTLDSQRHELTGWCKRSRINSDKYKWYEDKISGATSDRPALNRLLSDVSKGKIGCVVVYKLDRLSRSTQHGLEVLKLLASHKVRVVSICENLEFNGPMGEFVYTLLMAVSTMERESIISRVKSGVAAYRTRNGGKWGRSPDWHKRAEVQRLRSSGLSVLQIAEQMNCTRSNIYQLLAKGQSRSIR